MASIAPHVALSNTNSGCAEIVFPDMPSLPSWLSSPAMGASACDRKQKLRSPSKALQGALLTGHSAIVTVLPQLKVDCM